MIFKFGLFLLFLLPVIESLNRQIGLALLIVSSILLFTSCWKNHFTADRIFYIWLIMLIIFSITTIHSQSLVRSVPELTRYFSLFFIFISIRSRSDITKILRKFFVPMIILNSLILTIFSLGYYLPFLNLPHPLNGMNLYFPSSGHNWISELLVYSIPLLLFEYVLSSIYKKKAFLLLGLFVFMLLISLGRGSMMVFLFCVLAYTIFSPEKFFKDNKLNKIILIMSTAIITLLLFIFIYSNLYIKGDSDKNIDKKIYRPVINEYRLDYFREAVTGFLKFPLLGNGLDTFTYISKIYSPRYAGWSDYTHNHFLQLFSDTGLLGGSTFILFIFMLFIKPFKRLFNKELSKLETGLLLALTASALHSLIDFDWQFNSLFALFFIGLAILNNQNIHHPSFQEKYLNKFLIPSLFIFFLIQIISGKYLNYFRSNSLQEITSLFSKGENDKVLLYLKNYERYDRLNSVIPDWYAAIYTRLKNYPQAHSNNKKAIILSGFHGESIMKRDYQLYLSESINLLINNNFQEAKTMLIRANEEYPSYIIKLNKSREFSFLILNSTNKNRELKKQQFNQFISEMQNGINNVFLDENEILEINNKLKEKHSILY